MLRKKARGAHLFPRLIFRFFHHHVAMASLLLLERQSGCSQANKKNGHECFDERWGLGRLRCGSFVFRLSSSLMAQGGGSSDSDTPANADMDSFQ